VPLATTGLVHPVWAMVAMVASVTAVLGNSFRGRMLTSLRGQPNHDPDPHTPHDPQHDHQQHRVPTAQQTEPVAHPTNPAETARHTPAPRRIELGVPCTATTAPNGSKAASGRWRA